MASSWLGRRCACLYVLEGLASCDILFNLSRVVIVAHPSSVLGRGDAVSFAYSLNIGPSTSSTKDFNKAQDN